MSWDVESIKRHYSLLWAHLEDDREYSGCLEKCERQQAYFKEATNYLWWPQEEIYNAKQLMQAPKILRERSSGLLANKIQQT